MIILYINMEHLLGLLPRWIITPFSALFIAFLSNSLTCLIPTTATVHRVASQPLARTPTKSSEKCWSICPGTPLAQPSQTSYMTRRIYRAASAFGSSAHSLPAIAITANAQNTVVKFFKEHLLPKVYNGPTSQDTRRVILALILGNLEYRHNLCAPVVAPVMYVLCQVVGDAPGE